MTRDEWIRVDIRVRNSDLYFSEGFSYDVIVCL